MIVWTVTAEYIEWLGGAGREVGTDYIEYTNVSRDDVHVLQCNASNVHGYLFVNAFLNVLGTMRCDFTTVVHFVDTYLAHTVLEECKQGAYNLSTLSQKSATVLCDNLTFLRQCGHPTGL